MTSSTPPASPDAPVREKQPTGRATVARAVLESLSDETLVLSVPGTDYRLHLVPTVPVAEIQTPLGKRIKGVIRARALRIHPAQGGGRFVEPVYGMPRIVAGRVISADESKREAVVDVTVPMVVTTMEGQTYKGIIEPGKLVNFYVESGTTFTPTPS